MMQTAPQRQDQTFERPPSCSESSYPARSHARSTRSPIIFLQAHQQLPELLLPGPICSALRSLPAEINQFGDPLPTCTARTRVLAVLEKFFGFLAGLRDRLVFLCIVVVVEIVNGGASRFACFGLFGGRGIGAVRKGEVAAFSPLSRKVSACLVERRVCRCT